MSFPSGLQSLIQTVQEACRSCVCVHVQAIAKGEEVTIGYTDLLQPAALRRASLAERYCFECSCARCREGGGTGDRWRCASSSYWNFSLAFCTCHCTIRVPVDTIPG